MMADETKFPPLYRRVRAAAAHRWAAAVLSAVAAAEAIVSPLPPDFLLAPMTVASPQRAWRLAALTTFWSVVGGAIGYVIGVFFMDHFGWALVDFYALRDHFENFRALYRDYGIAVVLIGAFTPIPYKVIAITSGVAAMNPLLFILVSIVGRGARFFIIAALCRVWGPAAETFLLQMAAGSSAKKTVSLVLIGSSIVLLGAFYFEYVLGLQPCPLCLWQRWPYYAVAALCALALLLPLERIQRGALVLSALILLGGAALGGYHAGVEWHFWPGLAQCGAAAQIASDTKNLWTQLESAALTGCEQASWRLLGLSLAGYNFLISAAFAGFIFWTLYGGKKNEQ